MSTIPTGFFFPRSRAEAVARLAIRTANERAAIRRIIAREKRGTIGSHYDSRTRGRNAPA